MYNKVVLVGNLTRDVELNYTQSGMAIAKFGLAVNERRKDKNTGEDRENTCFVDITVFARAAETASQYIKRGSKVLVDGRLNWESWTDQNGQKRSKHSIIANTVQFLTPKNESYGEQSGSYQNSQQYQNAQAPQQQAQQYKNDAVEEIDEDDIPF